MANAYDVESEAPVVAEADRFKPTFLIYAVREDGITSTQLCQLGSEGEARAIAQKTIEEDETVAWVQVFSAIPGKSVAKRITRVEFFS